MMKNIFMSSSSAIIELCAEEKIIKKVLEDEFLFSYIPSLKLINEVNMDDIQAKIYVEKSNVNKIDFDFPYINYKCKKIDTKDIISLVEYILERIRQENGIICIHGAGSIYNNKLIVCFGGTTGMGKTSLSLEISKNGGKFYSDEKIMIDLKNKKAIGRIRKQYVSNKYWENKLGNNKYATVDNLSDDIPYDIGIFIQPIICNQKNYELDKWTSKKFSWHLYEESSRKIRGTSRTFFGGTYPAPSLDTFEIAQTRLLLINKLCEEIECIYYKGNCNNIINYIKKLDAK